MEQRPRNSNGTFQKGQPSPEGARRKKGALNKITSDIKAGCIEGFARHGSNGRGEGGFAGFCYFLAKRHPKAAARIVEKLLPLNIHGSGLGNAVIGSINVVSVPPDRFVSANDLAKLQRPLELEHDPQPEQIDDAEHTTEIEPENAAEPENMAETGIQVIRSAQRRS